MSDYRSPSSILRVDKSDFLLRLGARICVGSLACLNGRYIERRKFFDEKRAEKRMFEVFYGFNPRHQRRSRWFAPGSFKWRRDR